MFLSKRSFIKSMVAVCVAGAFSPFAFSAEKLPAHWDGETDVIIVGSGFAGMSAAAEALTKGAKIIVFDKMPVPGGNSAIAGGDLQRGQIKKTEEKNWVLVRILKKDTSTIP